MTTLLLCFVLSGGHCASAAVVSSYSSHQAYVAPVVAYHQAYTYYQPAQAVFLYGVGDTQRLQKLEEIAQQNQQLLQQQAQLVQAISAQGGGGAQFLRQQSEKEVAARAVFRANCTSCHTGATAKGGLDLSGPPLSVGELVAVDAALATAAMPPDGPLSDKDYGIVRQWVFEDGKAVRAYLRERAQASTRADDRDVPPRPEPPDER